jgi:hypothetical protein
LASLRSGAGLIPGDRFVLEPWAQLAVWRSKLRGPRPAALHVRSGGEFARRRFRFHPAERRFEHETSAASAITRWTPVPVEELEIVEKPWRLRLCESGPVLGTVRRFGEKLACAPSLIDLAPGTSALRSRWTWVDDGVARTLEVSEGRRISHFERGRDDDVEFDVTVYRERIAGLTLLELVRLVEGKLDVERAAAIASQLVEFDDEEYAADNDIQPACVVGFDGVVRQLPSWERSLRGTRSWWFGWLTHPAPPLASQKDELDAQLRFSQAAAVGDVAELVRNLAPERWERERAFLDEVALLA